MEEKAREQLQAQRWGIEVYHRGIKQCSGVERAEVRTAAKQIGHITLSLLSGEPHAHAHTMHVTPRMMKICSKMTSS